MSPLIMFAVWRGCCKQGEEDMERGYVMYPTGSLRDASDEDEVYEPIASRTRSQTREHNE